MVNSSSKKDGKKQSIQKDQYLNAIAALGIDGILYPTFEGERHPNTRELIVMAMESGINQEQIAKLCKVSQPLVSQWANGSSSATKTQLLELIPRLKSTAPGHQWVRVNVARSASIDLPLNWEESFILQAFKNEVKVHFRGVSYTSDFINEDLLERSIYGQINNEYQKKSSYVKDSVNSEISNLKNYKVNIEKLLVNKDEEIEFNKENNKKYHDNINDYFIKRPELNTLDEVNKQSLINREIVKPDDLFDAQSRFEDYILNISELLCVNSDMDEINSEIDIRVCDLSEGLEVKLGEIDKEKEIDLSKKSIYGSYDKDKVRNVIVSKNGLFDDEIKSYARELYPNGNLSLTVEINGYGYEGRDNSFSLKMPDRYLGVLIIEKVKRVEISIDLCQGFVDYCAKLKSNLDLRLIQLSGSCIFDKKLSYQDVFCDVELFHDFKIEAFSIRIYRLYSDKLFLMYSFNEGEFFYNLALTGDDVLSSVDEIVSVVSNQGGIKVSDELRGEITNLLLDQGYILENVEMMY